MATRSALKTGSSRSPRQTQKKKNVSILLDRNEVALIPGLDQEGKIEARTSRARSESSARAEKSVEELQTAGLENYNARKQQKVNRIRSHSRKALGLLEAKKISGREAASAARRKLNLDSPDQSTIPAHRTLLANRREIASTRDMDKSDRISVGRIRSQVFRNTREERTKSNPSLRFFERLFGLGKRGGRNTRRVKKTLM